MRIGELEFRQALEGTRMPEIVRWQTWPEGKEYCYTLLFWEKDREGYYIYFIGGRPLDKDIDQADLFKLMRYGQAILDAKWEVERE